MLQQRFVVEKADALTTAKQFAMVACFPREFDLHRKSRFGEIRKSKSNDLVGVILKRSGGTEMK